LEEVVKFCTESNEAGYGVQLVEKMRFLGNRENPSLK